MSHIAHIGPSWSHTQLAVSRHNKELLQNVFVFLPRSEGVSIPVSKFSLRCCLWMPMAENSFECSFGKEFMQR